MSVRNQTAGIRCSRGHYAMKVLRTVAQDGSVLRHLECQADGCGERLETIELPSGVAGAIDSDRAAIHLTLLAKTFGLSIGPSGSAFKAVQQSQ